MASDFPAFFPDPASLVGTWRRFGQFGPSYQIARIVRVQDNGDTIYEVEVPGPRQSEVLERRFSEILADPEEA